MAFLPYVPYVGVVIVLSTLLIIEIIAATDDTYWTGNIALPYISDTGRDPPSYYIFAIGVTAACANFGVQHAYISIKYASAVKAQSESSCCWYCTWVTACVLTVLGMFGFILLACFNTSDYPSLHDYSAYAGFALLAIALPCFTGAAGCIRKETPEAMPASSFRAKLVCCVLFWIAFVIYLPVGLAVVCAFERLPLADCKATYALGDAYCDSKLLVANESACLAPPCTTLWDYGTCAGVNTLRSSTQLACVILLMLFQGTFVPEYKWLTSRASLEVSKA